MAWFTDTGRNLLLDSLAASGLFASLHSAYPDDTGSNELTGGAPAYTREAITWNAPAGGVLDNNVNPTFDVPAGASVAWIGIQSAATGAAMLLRSPLGGTTPRPFTAEDATDVIACVAHGYADGQRVVLMDTDGAALPVGTTEGTVYFVRDATADTFRIALTAGGPAVDLTGDGAGFVTTIAPETFTGQGQLTVSDLDVALRLG